MKTLRSILNFGLLSILFCSTIGTRMTAQGLNSTVADSTRPVAVELNQDSIALESHFEKPRSADNGNNTAAEHSRILVGFLCGSMLSSNALDFSDPSSPYPAIGMQISYEKANIIYRCRLSWQTERDAWTESGSFLGSYSQAYNISPARSIFDFSALAGTRLPFLSIASLEILAGLGYQDLTTRGKQLDSTIISKNGWFSHSGSETRVYEENDLSTIGVVLDLGLVIQSTSSTQIEVHYIGHLGADGSNYAQALISLTGLFSSH